MATMSRDEGIVTRAKIKFAFSLDPKTGRARDKQHPLVEFLIVRFFHWSGLSGRDYPLNAHTFAGEQLRKEFPARLTGKVVEEIHHS